MSGRQAERAAVESRRHLVFGWWALLFFLSLGLVLEALHGFKVGLYLDVGQSTRRLMWTLAHAHGTLLALVNLAFAFTVERVAWTAALLRLASRCLLLAAILLPLGFLLGGVDFHGGDPGYGVALVALGGLILLVGVLATVRAVTFPASDASLQDGAASTDDAANKGSQKKKGKGR